MVWRAQVGFVCYFQHNLYRHTWNFTRFTNERILHFWFKNIYNVLCMLWWSQGILKANFCTTFCGYMHFQIPPCSTLRWKIRAFHLLLHLWSREGGIIAVFHPKVEFFHLFQLQCSNSPEHVKWRTALKAHMTKWNQHILMKTMENTARKCRWRQRI